MSEPLKQALREALAAYLLEQLAPSFPDLVVLSEWPAPSATLADPTIAVLAAGVPESQFHIPRRARTQPLSPPVDGQLLVTFTYAYVVQNMQLDVWTTSQPSRDAVSRGIEQALNRPAKSTLGIQALPGYRRRRGVVLPGTSIPGLFNMPVEYRFEAAPSLPDDATSAASGEFRASWSGTADAYCVDQQQAAVLQRVILQFNGGTPRTIT